MLGSGVNLYMLLLLSFLLSSGVSVTGDEESEALNNLLEVTWLISYITYIVYAHTKQCLLAAD